MAKQGRATIAIGLSIGSSFFAAVIGVLAVMAIAEPLIDAALAFGPPEYFALAAIGISFVAALSQSSVAKGLVMAAIGLMLTTVGVDAVIGEPRFTFGLLELQDGIGLVPAMTGLFAITEIVNWIQQKGTIARLGRIEGSVWQGLFATIRYPISLIRSTLVGLMVGLVPGIGATAASFLSYEVEKRSAAKPERFGQGAPEGVIAPEAANNSAIAAGLAPALMLGIPGGATSALLLVALTVHGLRPGIMLFSDQPDLVYGFFIGLLIGAFTFMFVSAAFARTLAKVTVIKAELIAPVFLVISFAGVYAQDQQFSDIVVAMTFGLFGCLAKMLGFPAVPLVLGLVLGRTLETSFHQSLAISGGDWSIFFTRPLSGALLGVALAVIFLPLLTKHVRRARTRHVPNADGSA
jgi:putative tricarboxylic transport membrane protein